jgi:hypothetical protein
VKVGINYPWLHCGWDFGPEPPGYGPRVARAELRADLTRLARAGVQIVRWFVLADGFVYGTGELGPQREKGTFRFTAEAALPASFVDDFASLLALCAELGLQLLPVLIDYHFAFPGLARDSEDARTLSLWDRTPRRGQKPSLRLLVARERASRLPAGYVKGGRADVIADSASTGRFIERVLVPLLAASQRYEHAIYAWELINEPEWIMRRMPFEPGFRLPRAAVCRFMERGLGVIRDHGFLATVGFARARSLRSLQGELPALALNQLHYYPRGRFARLAPARFANGRPAILGEFATESAVLGPWPDLPAGRQDIAARLALAREHGYQAALLWSYRARDRATLADCTLLEREISRFVGAG